MNLLETCMERCKKNPKRIVFADANDVRVMQAARYLVDEKIAEPILIGGPMNLRDEADRYKVSTRGFLIMQPSQGKDLQKYAGLLYDERKHKGLSIKDAEQLIQDNLYYGAMLVRNNAADICIAGNLSLTADVLRSAIKVIGLPQRIKTVSSFFIMISPDVKNVYAFADGGVIPEPSSEQLSDIAITTEQNYKNITGNEPKAVMLSFSTKGSADHPSIKRIQEATAICQSKDPDLIVDGEMQFDAAIDPKVGRRKAAGSPVQGEANVFIFPSLEAGNIGYKIAERLGGYSALGPFIQGLKNPMHDLSRGCSTEDIINSVILSSCMVN